MRKITKRTSRFIVLIALSTILGCERDDLCPQDTPITPQLVIDFFDNDNPSEPLAPRNLGIIEEGAETGFAAPGTTIFIPLRTDADQTRLRFVLNSSEPTEEDPENADLLVFNYERIDDFISKACGIRVVFSEFQEQIFPEEDGFWIQNIEVESTLIENENETHIRIFH